MAAAAAAIPELSASQARALHRVTSGENVFITGSGGSGKSFLIERMHSELRDRGKTVALTATTGHAALNIGGTTFHVFLGLGLAQEPLSDLIRKASSRRFLRQRMRSTQVLIIDEISMMSPVLFETADAIIRVLRGVRHEPFGGMQVILVGDFFQIPPVDRTGSESGLPRYVFETSLWRELLPSPDQIVELTEAFRQKDDVDFLRLLRRTREGVLTPEDAATLQSRVGAPLPEAEKVGIAPTVLVSRRATAEALNNDEMKRLPRDTEHVYEARTEIVGARDAPHRKILEAELQRMLKDMQAPQILTIRTGAQVMIVRNLDPIRGLVNGTRGVVVGFSDSPVLPLPIVRTTYGDVKIPTAEWKTKHPSGGEITIETVPLQLAWAITHHKAQGQTLQYAKICLDRSVFDTGMAYVALSRAVCLRNITLTHFSPDVIQSDPRVVEFYRRVRNEQRKSPGKKMRS